LKESRVLFIEVSAFISMKVYEIAALELISRIWKLIMGEFFEIFVRAWENWMTSDATTNFI
jgi:hypothetical protein